MTASPIEPMRIYVLWHKDCEKGQEFAKEIYTWFRGDPGDLSQCGYGIPVEYRSYPSAVPLEQRRAIDLNAARINVVVPLVDEHMVVDAPWRKYLSELVPEIPEKNASSETLRNSETPASSLTKSLICPVALHSAAYQLPAKITQRNFLRIDRTNDPKDWSEEHRLQVQQQRLLSLLTQVCCRLLWQPDEPGAIDMDAPSSPIKVFISHAKSDGTDIAEAIRNQIYQHGQLQAFFDESDLAIGYGWNSALNSNAHLGTAAMIAVLTDSYAGRPWCRREIRLARTAQPISPEQLKSDGGTEIEEGLHGWTIKPLVVVDALENGTNASLPDFGNAPVIRWHPERVPFLIDQLLREILLYGYNEKRVRGFLTSSRSSDEDKSLKESLKKDGQHYLNCIPDLQTILELWQKTTKSNPNPETESSLTRLVVPPPGISLSEEQLLREFVSSMTQLQIVTFDDMQELDESTISRIETQAPLDEQPISPSQTQPPLKEKLIAVSISDSADLIQFGYGMEHLHELTVNIARLVLRLGGNLAYGGDLRPGGFTETLFLLARGEHMSAKGWEQRLYSFLSWPYYQSLSKADEAKLINTCCFVRVRPEDAIPGERLNHSIDPNTPEGVYQSMRCLSYMRERMTIGGALRFDGEETPALAARILVAGKSQDFMGIMPGLFEEYFLAAEKSIPTYILGGFGGAAHILAEALRTQDEQQGTIRYEDYRSKQASLLVKKFTSNPADEYKPYPEGSHPRQLYDRLNACLRTTRKDGLASLKNGLTAEENEKLMTTTDSKVGLSLLSKGLLNALSNRCPE